MDYKKHYNLLMGKRTNNPPSEHVYSERHHIIPVSLGGTNNKNNLVILTAREHFVAHMLLAEMYPKLSKAWISMNCAFRFMRGNPNEDSLRYTNSRYYELKMSDAALAMSISQKGEKNSQFGTCWIYNIELLECIRINKEKLPEYTSAGWKKGRRLHLEKDAKLANKLWGQFLETGHHTITEFTEKLPYHRQYVINIIKEHLGFSSKEVRRVKIKEICKREIDEYLQSGFESISAFSRSKGFCNGTHRVRWANHVPEHYKNILGK